MAPHVWRRPFAVVTTALLTTFGFAGVAGAVAPTTSSGATTLAPLIGAERTTALKGRYIVVLRDGVSSVMARSARTEAEVAGGRVQRTYAAALHGFAATLSQRGLDKMRANPDVKYIEADQKVSINTTQSPATWGIDRIDQRNLPLSNSYTYTPTGAGITAYIIDTGIRYSHQQFGGRAVSGFDAVDGGSADDCNGHGTHVAGTVGSATYGVAKGVRLVGVRVLDCNGSGTTAGVIAGIDWVTSNHTAGQPAAANMSLGGGASTSLDNAVVNSINDGVTYAIAAGNDSGANACNYSPARVGAAITVGSTTSTDARSSFSNIGTCLDIFAPGSSIQSTWHTSDTATNTISGTSMATPHVTGAAVLYLQGNPSASPSTVRNALVGNATQGVVGNPGSGSPNLLLYTGAGGQEPPPASGCAALPSVYTGSLSGTGAVAIQPNGTSFTSGGGTFRGCLDGPSGVDFDLYLQKLSGSFWITVAQGISTAPDEDVTYTGTSGTYRWRIVSYRGSGSYTFGMTRP
ncbi:S8 family peptidase [Actinopolymorpha alba]|uniref:S8 family peptidase n=1 Tax=Actinopolymorpha alba TaxID=533267 RepID=UPI00036E0065|nr:S8 family peptidase [Actinopolymorpha alba]